MSGGDNFTATHWGVYRPRVADGRLTALDPAPWDKAPSAIGRSVVDGIDAPAHIRRPAVREGFLRHGPASRDGRGREPFVELSWDEALDLAARELDRVRRDHGNAAIFGGSYGWASAGRFHHAQSQLHRFLNCIGGYTAHSDTYSLGAGRVLMPRILASMDDLMLSHTAWTSLEKHCELFVAFGGLPARNAQVGSGGASDHLVKPALGRLAAAGVRFVNVSPVRHDLDDVPGAEWIAIRPGTDTAVMLGLAHTLVAEGLADGDFLARCTVGYEEFRRYLTGEANGLAKDAGWAATIAGVPAETIVTLARRMAGSRTMMNLAWSLQRAVHGEQPFWMGVTLAAMLGQIGTPGGGLGVGYSVMNTMGSGRRRVTGPRLPQGRNPVDTAIPVARIADMLLNPGTSYRYNGQTRRYPDIRLVHWAGGNAFHHHQDINRLVRAWRRPETVIVQDPFWTAQAKFADIVLPATTALERDDIGGATGDRFLVWMARALDPVGEARDDHAILAGLAGRLGVEAEFTGGLTTEEWLERLYEECRFNAPVPLPDFRSFLAAGLAEIPLVEPEKILLQAFRADPDGSPLPTPSGRIEIGSAAIAGFGLPDCPGHPVWRDPAEHPGLAGDDGPLHLLSCQPATRLHSQYDHGVASRESKISGREPIRIHPDDAAARGIGDGDVVRVFNRRGAFLAGAVLTDGIRPGVLQIATGAWYDPVDPDTDGSLDAHGNPNMVTPDTGTSTLAQGCSAQSALVDVERFTGPLPAIRAFQPPRFVSRHET
ncbi:biotin transporter BioY [Azospirillum sp. TSH100]|uniref:molybdopterin-dependent oxidoreductase n=1 Tax=Azospirillum sp. TSH100 TaxID=652764 RepID=UPI000D6131FB|nr:molybdopterin-dependent oxidoreductase [Azospirillum sp. TSH100]PWC89340.1 biotin transporter BioY [Azospirillum sp. TSH100]QCG90303.1 Asp-tRNA(Asn)/Glu-tRNA(Gln) amidotransferase GatCAB subunit C [Azospirillum sp. TSH100]